LTHFKKFCSFHKIPDAGLLCVATFPEAAEILASYALSLALGDTIQQKYIASETLKRYVREAEKFIESERTRASISRQYAMPSSQPRLGIMWTHPTIRPGTNQREKIIKDIIDEIVRWENVPNRRDPLTTDMIMALHELTNPNTPHSEVQAIVDWFIIGIHLGFHLSKNGHRSRV
jgi:hypothetical protein